MGDPPLDEEEYRCWRDDADAALRSAHLQTDDGLYNWAYSSSEQSAQLAVRGLPPLPRTGSVGA